MGTLNTVLCFGDIVGVTGRFVLKKYLNEIKKLYNADFIIANGENSANGVGITRDTAGELFNSGVDVITGGNHIWNNKDVFALLPSDNKVLRPYNYPPQSPGLGYYFYEFGETKIAVISLLGRTFMEAVDCPFQKASVAIKHIKEKTNNIFIDFHAEATAEKLSFAFHFENQVTAIFGTHTHVQTADERLIGTTAYITDVGMCGSFNSVIGMKKEAAIQRFVMRIPHRFEVETASPMINAVAITFDSSTGKAIAIKRINIVYEDKIE